MKFKQIAQACVASVLFNQTALAQDTTHVYWGDTHLHTSYSLDAFLSLNYSADPDTAYRWAKGQPVIHPYTRAKVSINEPLDFLVVSDHAEAMGVIRAISRGELKTDNEKLTIGGKIKAWFTEKMVSYKVTDRTGMDLFNSDLLPTPDTQLSQTDDPVLSIYNTLDKNALGNTAPTVEQSWSEIVDMAERHNEPGKFSAFVGWEWSSIPTGANLHRVIISPNGAQQAKQYLPFGSDQSQYPEDLWAWLEKTAQQTGSEFLAIPHNSNVSKGYMFPEVTLRGQPITVEYARTRLKWEPVFEVTQIKGDSETHPLLSPNDEFAGFEKYNHYLQNTAEEYRVSKGDFIRSGLLRGLEQENKLGINPFKLGMIGSTDSHTGLSSAEEDNFWGKYAHDSTPESKRGQHVIGEDATGWSMQAGGLAAAWAKENTRDSIYAAFKRREVYASTGPRIKLRVFGGWDFEQGASQENDISVKGYQKGVPMGGDLVNPKDTSKKIQLLIRATKDPRGANLDRVQVVKGWLDATTAKSHEKIFSVAWAGERTLSANGDLPVVGDTVNRNTASYTNDIGDVELSVLWQDPEFNSSERAFYYVRVLQIPTPRHSLYDAVAAKEIHAGAVSIPSEGPAVIQERAYSSPIWYTP